MDINDIFNEVKENFTYITDEEKHGVLEKWSQPDGTEKFTGDCEDFAIASRILCKKHGIPSRFIYCKDETGAGHLILEAGGHFYLDNRMHQVVSLRALKRLGYKFISVSGYEPFEPWREVI